jgi:hypothetical protein
MAINKNHEFEDLEGVKCAIVERNVLPARVEFLKKLLEYNGYTVVVVKSPPPKVAPPKPVVAEQVTPVTATATDAAAEIPAPPETFTVGVTDVTFNAVNAIMGRLLKTPDKHIVTLAYWQQKEDVSNDEVPYYEKPNN